MKANAHSIIPTQLTSVRVYPSTIRESDSKAIEKYSSTCDTTQRSEHLIRMNLDENTEQSIERMVMEANVQAFYRTAGHIPLASL